MFPAGTYTASIPKVYTDSVPHCPQAATLSASRMLKVTWHNGVQDKILCTELGDSWSLACHSNLLSVPSR
jgi:hypothetical protein